MSGAGDDYVISTSAERLDVDFVCRALASSYWARHRTREVILASIRASLCFGLYEREGGAQVGFGRVVTDGATFSWLCDVVIDEAHRGRGLGKLLVAAATGHPGLEATTFMLGTRDAHGLYERFGFVRSEMMRRAPPAGTPGTPQGRAQE